MEALQLERLRAAVARVLARVPPLAARLRAAGITSSDDIRSLADLRRLPFTRKIDLREHYPFGRFAVPVAGLVRIHASSGTRGKPTIVGYTRNDLAMWSELVARPRLSPSASEQPAPMPKRLLSPARSRHDAARELGGQRTCEAPVCGGRPWRRGLLRHGFYECDPAGRVDQPLEPKAGGGE
jgi:hypothetical protein